ncbi:hypothetical protein HK101_009013 [Irineochytrium annulatum]|nr:hypothetical protein HK101_009013 [Irineochytrium annulatum]
MMNRMNGNGNAVAPLNMNIQQASAQNPDPHPPMASAGLPTVQAAFHQANGAPVPVANQGAFGVQNTVTQNQIFQFQLKDQQTTAGAFIELIGVGCINGQLDLEIVIFFNGFIFGELIPIINQVAPPPVATTTAAPAATTKVAVTTAATIIPTSTAAPVKSTAAAASSAAPAKSTAAASTGAGFVSTTAAGGNTGASATSAAADPAATAPPAAAAGMDCIVTVPANAFTAAGLSTPWQVTGCDQTATPTFVDCTIIDTATGALSVYYPLLVNKGAVAGKDFIAPNVPTLPAANAVMCHFGTNGMTTTLAGATAANQCVNGLPNVKGDIFGQFAACGATAFWAAVNKAIGAGQITAGAAGAAGTIAGAAVGGLTKGATGLNGKPCYTTHSFELVDMDPSDNMMASFLQDANGKLAQNTTENIAAMGAKATAMTNGSDNRLLVSFLDADLKCAALLAPDMTNMGRTMAGSVALNEIQATLLQQAPIAMVSSMDPMVLTTADAAVSLTKQNLYRAQVNQPQIANAAAAAADHLAFCQNYVTVGAASIVTDAIWTFGATTPAANAGKDLYTFLGQRWMMGFQGLTCDKLLNIKTPPIVANFDANMVCQNLTFPDQTFMGVNLFQLAQGCGLVDAKGVPTNKKPTACKAAGAGLVGTSTAPVAVVPTVPAMSMPGMTVPKVTMPAATMPAMMTGAPAAPGVKPAATVTITVAKDLSVVIVTPI